MKAGKNNKYNIINAWDVVQVRYWTYFEKKLVKSCQVNSFWALFSQLKPQWRVASTVKKQRPQRSQPMQPQEREIKVNLLKFGWKNLWNQIRWTYFWRFLIIWNYSGASCHQSRNKGHSVPRPHTVILPYWTLKNRPFLVLPSSLFRY